MILKRAIRRLLYPHPPPHAVFRSIEDRVRGRDGIEIGGPSPLFRQGDPLPVYPLARRIDNCEFAINTYWHGSMEPGWTFRFDERKPPGYQHVVEAVTLNAGATGRRYGFVLASHVIEHLANPAAALKQWFTLLEPGGLLIAVLPNPRDTFDHRRPVTPLPHLIDDFERGTSEHDLTHLDEILALHDLERDPQAGSAEAFRQRSLDNFTHRCLHHHVFSLETATGLLAWSGYQVEAAVEAPAVHFFLIASRGPA